MTLLRAVVTNEVAAARIQAIFATQLAPLIAKLCGEQRAAAAARAGLIATQILGLALCRYVLKLEGGGLQPVRMGLISFNAALVGFVEAHRDDDAEKAGSVPLGSRNADPDGSRSRLVEGARPPGVARTLATEPDTRPARSCRRRTVQRASQRFAADVGPGLKRLAAIVGQAAA